MAEDYEKQQEREDEQQERRDQAEIAVRELKNINRSICCVFICETEEVVHGRIEGMLAELDALVVRDLTPGKQALQCKRLIPYGNISNLCTSPAEEKCRQCFVWRDLNEAYKEAQEGKKNGKD